MLSARIPAERIRSEVERISDFIHDQFRDGERTVVAVSGGVDSDVATRLAFSTLGPDRVKLFTVLQDGTNPRHLANARNLARELSVGLAEINMAELPCAVLRALREADPEEAFRPEGLTDLANAKNSLRTAIASAYLNRGYLILGTSNRTELETGFFVPLGDGLGHVKPLAHLYKTQVYQVAEAVGTCREVIEQPASSGNWIGAEDLEDLSFWLYNEAPIGRAIHLSAKAMGDVMEIRAFLTTERLDAGLLALARGLTDEQVSDASEVPVSLVVRLRKLTAAARKSNARPLGTRLPNLS